MDKNVRRILGTGLGLQLPIKSIRREPTFPESGGEHGNGSVGHGRMNSLVAPSLTTQPRKRPNVRSWIPSGTTVHGGGGRVKNWWEFLMLGTRDGTARNRRSGAESATAGNRV